jgi:thiol:disulfide interchange protein
MDKNILVFAAIVAVGVLTAFRYYGTAEVAEGGIEFFQGTWKEALDKSKLENKPIFLDIYASWCGPCKTLKRNTFSDEKVGSFFNEHFINVAVDGEQGDGLVLVSKYNIRGYPSLLMVDSVGQVLHSAMGYHSPKELIKFGESGLKENKK